MQHLAELRWRGDDGPERFVSGTGESTTDFAGEEREFCVRLGEIRRIEAKCGVGIGEVSRRLAHAALVINSLGKASRLEMLAAGVQIHADDVRETIYQGLIGKGMPNIEATKIVRGAIDDCGMVGLLDNVGTALVVLLGAQDVPEDERLGEARAGESPATPSNESISPASTEPDRPSA